MTTLASHSAAAAPDAPSLRAESRARRLALQERAAPELERWAARNRFHYAELARLFRLHIPAGSRVLHVGCGLGDALAAVEPAYGLGIDLSPAVIERARARHSGSNLRFHTMDPEEFEIDAASQEAESGPFDFVIIDHALADLHDIQSSLESIRRVCRPHTRLVLSSHNALWGPILRMASRLGLRRRTPEQNWLNAADVDNMLRLAGFEVVFRSSETLLPIRVPILNAALNRFLVKFTPFWHLGLTQMCVARPIAAPEDAGRLTATVLIPTRNERGNIENAIRRLPPVGARTEVIFVDGNSTDGTVEEIQRVIAANPGKDIRFIPQGTGKGKGDAVRKGFAAAKGDVLMILDADLTVPPEDMPRFFKPVADGTAEFINGTRLVYPMEDQAMRFLNKIGNRFFSILFTWLLGQRFRDTLCGTKVLLKKNYETIAANRAYFGDFDPFGDFDLIFGAAKANFKIIEVPVRYRARTYGETNIHRFRHGLLLLKMSWVAFKRLKLR